MAPARVPDTPVPPLPWVLAASDEEGLRERAAALATELRAAPSGAPDAVAARLAAELEPLPTRAVLLGRDREDLLRALAAGQEREGTVHGTATAPPRIAFVFSPLRAEHPGMGLDLLDASPAFRAGFDADADALAPYLDWSPLDVLRGLPDAPTLERFDVNQPLLFAMQVGLARLWQALGVEPGAVAGHSVGEIAAATIAGALDRADAARVITVWSEAVQRHKGDGRMVSVLAPASEVEPYFRGRRLWISMLNTPSMITVSGAEEAIEELIAELAEAGIRAFLLDLPGAAHSPIVDVVFSIFPEQMATIAPRPPALPFYSAVTGRRLDATPLDHDYWARNLSGPVLFEPAVRALLADGFDHFVEIGPRPIVLEAIKLIASRDAVALATLEQDDPGRLLTSLATLYAKGAPVDWGAVCGAEPVLAPRFWPSRAQPSIAVADTILAATPPLQRERAALELVRAEAARLLGCGAQAIDPSSTFKDLGFDSAKTVALRDALIVATGLRIGTTVAFDYPTPTAVARKLRLELERELAGPEPVVASAAGPKPAADEAAALQRIDDLDLDALVALSLEADD